MESWEATSTVPLRWDAHLLHDDGSTYIPVLNGMIMDKEVGAFVERPESSRSGLCNPGLQSPKGTTGMLRNTVMQCRIR